ncbi:YARHG domain-containing protein [Clostridium sp. DL1XJH146]
MKWKNEFISITIVIFCLISITSCGNTKKNNEAVNDAINIDAQNNKNNIDEDIENKEEIIEKNDEKLEKDTDDEFNKDAEKSKYNEINMVSVNELNSNAEKYMDKYVKLQGTIDYIDEKEIICEMIIKDGSQFIDVEYYDTTDYFKGDYITIEGIVASYASYTYNGKPALMTTIEATKIGNIVSADVVVETNLVGGYIFEKSDKEKLTYTQINSLDNYSLKIARNEIFARHGYDFKSSDLKDYFAKKDWYKSNANYKGELNPTETYNVNLILKEENNR